MFLRRDLHGPCKNADSLENKKENLSAKPQLLRKCFNPMGFCLSKVNSNNSSYLACHKIGSINRGSFFKDIFTSHL